ncbi:MAG: LysM peptidoglycan-binding domain-containing protein [Chloroflexi bacterium]|nr:LysM peptidoglycan-binding domain-containing protein [Chloroflexota bacterium]
MADGFKICPICDTPARRDALTCSVCGSSLANAPIVTAVIPQADPQPLQYDYRYGETDLYEENLRRTGRALLLGSLLTILLLIAVGLFISFGPGLLRDAQSAAATAFYTPRPTILIATVTDSPPTLTPSATPPPSATPTATPTETPCTRTVQAGDTLISIILSCGYNDTSGIMDEVMEINNITNAALIQQGTTLIVPWPTPTLDPNISPSATTEGGASGDVFAAAAEEARDPFIAPTATLQPGVMWYVIQPNDNILSIAVQFNADVEILSQLNPEITFSQCDFGEFGGGPNCIVTVYQGQQIRVPAPTPMPTLQPTPSGSETPTPTATATFNAPSAISPGNLAHFQRDELVTLRWVGSGTLGENETYRVRVDNLTDNTRYTQDTRELFLIVPVEWQGTGNQRYQYAWAVSVINLSRPDQPIFTTESRTFTWQGRGGN